MTEPIRIQLTELVRKKDLWSVNTVPKIKEQLQRQGRMAPDEEHYSVVMQIQEGADRPCYDLDNYFSAVMDGITYTELLWSDDKQIDRVQIYRSRVPSQPQTTVEVDIQRGVS